MTAAKPPLTREQQEARDWLMAQAGVKVDPSVSASLTKHLRDKVAKAWAALSIGDIGRDGSVFAGLTPDGSQRIMAMPTDLDVTFSFDDAAKHVVQLNADKALGHEDWHIPTLEQLKILHENRDRGALKGTFPTSVKSQPIGCDYPDLYWSSTEDPDYPSSVHFVSYSNGYQNSFYKGGNRLSCRPVRLVPARAQRPGRL